jgi:hypothetical protein
MKSIIVLIVLCISLIEIKTDDINNKILCIINQNLTLNIDKKERVWSFKDLNSENIIDTNSTKYSLIPFKFEDAGREMYLKDLETNKILKTFHIIGIEDKCKIEIVNKDQEITLICSIKVKKKIGNGIIQDPVINWLGFNKNNESLKDVSLNRTRKKMEIFDSNNNILKYSSEITFKLPQTDELIRELNNQENFCQISHEASQITEIKIDIIPVTCIFCSIHLNINFNPFKSEKVNRTQFLNENQLSSIECPIKSPNFKPFKYSINWYYRSPDHVNETWLFKYSKTFDNSGDFYIISNAKYGIDNGIYKCDLIENLSGNIILSEILTVKFNQLSPKATSLMDTEFNNIFIYTLLLAFFIVLIAIILVIKFKMNNKKVMRVTVDQDQQQTDIACDNNNLANLKYEKTNMQSNRLYNDVDERVYKENSYTDDQSIIKKLASLDTKAYIVHLANKLKHKKSCPMYRKNEISYTETSMSSFKSISHRSDSTLKPIFQKNVKFNLRDSVSNVVDYEDSECMESIYIHGFNITNENQK